MSPAAPVPKWHMGHVIVKLMQSQNLTRQELATQASIRPNTLSNLLAGGNYEPETLDKIARALRATTAQLHQELERANIQSSDADAQRRATERDYEQLEAEQMTRRVMLLPRIARLAIYNIIAAFEDAYQNHR